MTARADTRQWWKDLARVRQRIIDRTLADVDRLEEEIKALLAEQAQCTCRKEERP